MSTLGEIRNNVRANLGEATPKLYQNTDLNRYIAEAYKYYSSIITGSANGYFTTYTNLPITSGVESISLASLPLSFISVSVLYKNTELGRQPLLPLRNKYTFINTQYSVGGNYYFPDYDFMGNTLILIPPPQITEAATSTTGLRLEYNYEPIYPDSTSSDSFSFDSAFRVSWEPLIVLWATIAALEQKDASGGISDINTFRSRLSTIETQFKETLDKTETPDQYEYTGTNYNSYF